MLKEILIKIIDYTEKHQDVINILKSYLGVFLLVFIMIKFNWIGFSLDGLFNSQVEIIIDICMNSFGGCP